MKHKGLYVLATVAMLALAAGCGSKQGEENSQDKVTEAISPTEEPGATATPEPTATPAPTATPVPANYMEANGIEVLGAGWHTCKGFMAKEGDENGNPILELADREYCLEVTEEENEGGTKVIQVALHAKPHVNEHGGYSMFAMGGFVDLQTGKAFLPMDAKLPHTTLIKHEEKEYELQLTCELEYPSATYPYYTEHYTLVCPSDYDAAGFYMTGYNFDWETFVERAGLWKMLNFIRHGESDLLVFGVNKGLATESEKKPADGAELAEENYFEIHGLTTRGEGRVTYLGTELLQRKNSETGLWEDVSVETKEVEIGFSVTEELLGDGTKHIKGKFMFEDEVTENEYRGICCKMGVVDKRTGLVYPTQTYNLAKTYVLEKEGEQFSVLVGRELIEKEVGCVEITISVICPEDYDDLVFFLTGNYMEEEVDYTKPAEVKSIHDLEHGESDLLFLR